MKKLSPPEILDTISKQYDKSIAEIASMSGYERAQGFYDVINGKTKRISITMANNIMSAFPELNQTWLLMGEGEMLKDAKPDEITEENVITGKIIPFYDAEAAAGMSYEMDMTPAKPIGMIEIGGLLKDSESALRVYGNSMTPFYPAGCVVGLKRHTDRFIEPGCVYVIETRDNRYLKRLYYNEDKTAFRCVSDNHMIHEDGPIKGEFYYPVFEVHFDDVVRLHRVIGVIKRNVI